MTLVFPRREAEAQAFLDANPDIESVHVVWTDMCGVARGKVLRRDEVVPAWKDGRFIKVIGRYDDDIVRETVTTANGQVLHPRVREILGLEGDARRGWRPPERYNWKRPEWHVPYPPWMGG